MRAAVHMARWCDVHYFGVPCPWPRGSCALGDSVVPYLPPSSLLALDQACTHIALAFSGCFFGVSGPDLVTPLDMIVEVMLLNPPSAWASEVRCENWNCVM